MTQNNDLTEKHFQQASEQLLQLRSTLESAIAGQTTLVTEVIISLVAGGHILIEGLPGLGKTHLAKALAAATGLNFSRVQCTPDLMPADITGNEILSANANAENRLEFQPGPVFSNLVLVDEINRATPKTQSSLLEAMQEQQVTCGGTTHPLPAPFWVIATQNPIEIEGTYPLPEAQLDRFMVKLGVHFPDAAALLSILEISLDSEPADQLEPVLDRERILQIMQLGREIIVSDRVRQAAVQLLLCTHPRQDGESHHFRYGASPRGLQALIRTARVHALINGRLQVDLDDPEAMALPTLRHRVILTIESELDGIDSAELLTRLIRDWRERA
jgi:MoxR-like ATPase